ncbi:type IV pilus modification protein PilV [Acinetobacter pecorum]|uniref:Type IV pilus modification protein PilV n=1 Tax=Acinetobacter pecorum TaxID=2762215 RepID=A0ABR8VXG4_9GAMM|nr:type IV pilus modification protein PilV [Acinetobacter pecorum]MBD8009448.1 type IV pilus modification protein PilV [Acinetobacter pecorum]
MLSKPMKTQYGVGMMEVLVAIVILSIAILGFVALQVRATVATEEAIKRSDALVILHGLAEKIRLNSAGDYSQAIPTTKIECTLDSSCISDHQALADLYEQQQFAQTKNITLGVADCPNTSANQNRVCLIAAWNETEAEVAGASETNECLNSNGKYISNSDCLVLEAY